MDFDNTWNALTKPGRATVFFDLEGPPPFEPERSQYSAINAWWLAEFSRLIYKREEDESALAGTVTRESVLDRVGFHEAVFVNRGSNQCGVFEATAGEPLAVVAFRGTDSPRGWIGNFDVRMVPWDSGGRVHSGFKSALECVWEPVKEYIEGRDLPLFYTGHSLGGAMASLAATRIPPRATYTYGSPRPGDAEFGKSLKRVDMYRVVNHRDEVPKVPISTILHPYVHVCAAHYITHENTLVIRAGDEFIAQDQKKVDPSLRDTTDFRRWYYPGHGPADHAPQNYIAQMERQLNTGAS